MTPPLTTPAFMATQQNFGNQTNSSRGRKGPKVNDKGIEMINKKNLLNSVNFLNGPILEIPAVTTNGMKNIEHFIDKTLIESKQWYRCKWQNCTYSTIRSDSIVRHMRKHTGERPYKCWFCSYATIQSSALKIHMRRHTGERPYMCKYENCEKRFAVLNTLVVHERTHTGYKPYKCSFASCNYSSSDRCKLVNHLRKTHHVELDLSKSINSTILNGDSPSPASSSHSLALVGGAMSPAQLLSTSLVTSYTPFSITNSIHTVMNNGQASGDLNQVKIAGTSPEAFMPLNFLSMVSSSENTQNTQSNTSAFSTPQKRSKCKSAAQRKAANQSHSEATELNGQITLPVNRDENSIKRVMILVDKRIVNNRTSYLCKWPSCGYDTLRSDSIVRHIRSHTGERPYKCWYENCNYATIQRSTLKKHLSRHINSVF